MTRILSIRLTKMDNTAAIDKKISLRISGQNILANSIAMDFYGNTVYTDANGEAEFICLPGIRYAIVLPDLSKFEFVMPDENIWLHDLLLRG